MKTVAILLNCLKAVAILLNCFMLTFGICAVTEFPDDTGVVYFFFLTLYPIINIIVIVLGSKGSSGWLWLYPKRKELEEKKKIDALNNAVSKDDQKQ